MSKTELVALTAGQKQELGRCEKEIRENLDSVFKLGLALLRVRDDELFRGEFGTFQAYCTAKWSFTPQWANRLISARETKDRVDRMAAQSTETIVSVENECQARELGKHAPEYQADIWATAQGLVKPAKPGEKPRPPTSGDIARAAEQVLKEDSDDDKIIDAESKEVVLQNGLGEDCQPWEADFFLIDDDRKELVRLLSNSCKLLDKIAEEPGMEATNVPALKTVLKGFVLPHIRQSTPHAGCTECEGDGCARCYNYGFQMRAAFTKTAEESPSEAQLKFLRSFEPKTPADMPKHEVQRRLNAHIAYKRLTKPSKAMLKSEV